MVFVSFPRDLWVEDIPVGEGRINTAFEGGIDGVALSASPGR